MAPSTEHDLNIYIFLFFDSWDLYVMSITFKVKPSMYVKYKFMNSVL